MGLENIENNNTSLTATSEKEQIANIENAVVLTNAEQKGNYSCFDASDSLVFFAYSEQAAQVDAYNYAGEYQFSISLAYRDRGSVEIRCHENLLYINSKYGNVFVFNDDQLIERLSEEEASKAGYTIAWCNQRSVPIKIRFAKIYRYQENKKFADIASIPTVVIFRSYFQYAILALCLVAIAAKLLKDRKDSVLKGYNRRLY
jgi:hypothetical protein